MDSETAKYADVDRGILKVIDQLRDEHGSCTAGQVARRMGYARHTIIDRCRAMRDAGLVSWTQSPGSLRVITDSRRRLYDLIVQNAVEELAPLGCDDDDSIAGWCRQVVAMATAAAWPELVPQEDETSPGEAMGPDSEVEQSQAPVPAPDVGDPVRENYCSVCDKQCGHAGAFGGHLRSKKHQAAVLAAAS